MTEQKRANAQKVLINQGLSGRRTWIPWEK